MKISVRGWRRDHGENVLAERDLGTARVGSFDTYHLSQTYITPRPVGRDHSIQDASITINLDAQIILNGEYQVGLDFSAQEIAKLFLLLYSKGSIEDLLNFCRAMKPNPGLLRKVSDLPLLPAIVSLLEDQTTSYVGDLVQKTKAELLRTPNLGAKSVDVIEKTLALMDLHLGMELPGWSPKDIEDES